MHIANVSDNAEDGHAHTTESTNSSFCDSATNSVQYTNAIYNSELWEISKEHFKFSILRLQSWTPALVPMEISDFSTRETT